jgi:hypothetical protein
VLLLTGIAGTLHAVLHVLSCPPQELELPAIYGGVGPSRPTADNQHSAGDLPQLLQGRP